MPDPVTFYFPDHPHSLRTLRQKLEEEHEKRVHELVVSDKWEDFTERRGVIRGLEIALKLCNDLEQDMRN